MARLPGAEFRNSDTRIVYGARCMWWDTINRIGLIATGGHALPCCPHCGSVLMELESIAQWHERMEDYLAKTPNAYPRYRALMAWVRGKCYPTIKAAIADFEAQTREKDHPAS